MSKRVMLYSVNHHIICVVNKAMGSGFFAGVCNKTGLQLFTKAVEEAYRFKDYSDAEKRAEQLESNKDYKSVCISTQKI